MGQSGSKPEEEINTSLYDRIEQQQHQTRNIPSLQPYTHPTNHRNDEGYPYRLISEDTLSKNHTFYQSFRTSLNEPSSSLRKTLRSTFAFDDSAIASSIAVGFVASSLSFVATRRLVAVTCKTLKVSSGTPFARWPVAVFGTYVSACVATHVFVNATGEMYQRSVDPSLLSQSNNQRSYFQSMKHALSPETPIQQLHRFFPFKTVDWWNVSGLSINQSIDRSIVGITCGILAVLTAMSGIGPRGLLTILPSDLIKAGSFTRHWLRASGADYADTRQKHRLHAIGAQFGCHSCGKKIDVTRQTSDALLKANPDSNGELKNLDLTKPTSKQTSQQSNNQSNNQSNDQSNDQSIKKPFKKRVKSTLLPPITRFHYSPRTGQYQPISFEADPIRVPFKKKKKIKPVVPKPKVHVDDTIIGYVGDHIPPSALNKSGAPQIFLPQCPRCSNKQSKAVVTRRQTLVMQHWKRFTTQDIFVPFVIVITPFREQLMMAYFKFGQPTWDYVMHILTGTGS